MSFRINPYKIIRLVGLIAVLSYGFVEISEFRNKKIQETGKVEKKLNIRKKDFYNSPEEKEKILNSGSDITVLTSSNRKTETEQTEATVQNSDENKETKKIDETQQNVDKEKVETLKKVKEQKKAEEEAQRKIVDQIAQQKKALAEKKAKEAEAIAAAKKAKEQQEAAAREAEKKAKEKALAQQAQKKNNEVKKIPRKYIQVATLSSEAAAKSAVSKLGGSFSYHKIAGKGKTLYVIVSASTDNQATLSSLENQVKSKLPSSKYIIRSAGK